jgi:hypothetical protein
MQVAGLLRACPSVTLDKLNIQLTIIIYEIEKIARHLGEILAARVAIWRLV